MPAKKSKLALKKQTLRTLSGVDLGKAAGGARRAALPPPPPPSFGGGCTEPGAERVTYADFALDFDFNIYGY
jgi:hypothetical protein